MGSKFTKKKKTKTFDSELNQKIANLLVFNNNKDYKSKLFLNRAKTKNEDNSPNKSFLGNSNLKYRIRSRSRSKTAEKNKNENKSNSSEKNKEERLNEITKDDLDLINLTNSILHKIISLNTPFNGNAVNFYNSYFYNNLCSDDKKDISISKSVNLTSNLKKSFNSQLSSNQILQCSEFQADYNIGNTNLIKNMFNIRKIIRKNMEIEESLNLSHNKFLMQSGAFNNFNLNNSLLNNLNTSFNITENSFIRIKSDQSPYLKNSITLSPKNYLDKDNSQFLLNTSQDNFNNNNTDYFNENQSQVTSGLVGNMNNDRYFENNDKSILDKSNYTKNSNYFNNEFDFYVDDELKNKKQREFQITNNFSRITNRNLGTNDTSPNKSREKTPKKYKKRVYTKPPIVHVKMNMQDFIKDEIQEQSFYRQHPEYNKKDIDCNEKPTKHKNKTVNQTDDKLYNRRNIKKVKLTNMHINNRSFVDVIEKYSQVKEYKEKLNNRKKMKDIDFNHARAKQREINSYLFDEENENENKLGNNNSRDISNYSYLEIGNKSKMNSRNESNFITKEIEEAEIYEKYSNNDLTKKKSKKNFNNEYRNSSKESSNDIKIKNENLIKSNKDTKNTKNMKKVIQGKSIDKQTEFNEKRYSKGNNDCNSESNEEQFDVEHSPEFASKHEKRISLQHRGKKSNYYYENQEIAITKQHKYYINNSKEQKEIINAKRKDRNDDYLNDSIFSEDSRNDYYNNSDRSDNDNYEIKFNKKNLNVEITKQEEKGFNNRKPRSNKREASVENQYFEIEENRNFKKNITNIIKEKDQFIVDKSNKIRFKE